MEVLKWKPGKQRAGKQEYQQRTGDYSKLEYGKVFIKDTL